MKKLITGLMCIALCLIVGCSTPSSIIKNSLNSKPSTIKSYDGVFQVTVPGLWKPTTKGYLNKTANMEIGNTIQSKFFMTIVEKKEDFSTDFADYTTIITQQTEKGYNITLNQPTKTTVGKYNAYLNEFDTPSGKFVFHVWLYTVETDNYYGQIYVWTKKSSAESNRAEVTKIVNSFQENVTTK